METSDFCICAGVFDTDTHQFGNFTVYGNRRIHPLRFNAGREEVIRAIESGFTFEVGDARHSNKPHFRIQMVKIDDRVYLRTDGKQEPGDCLEGLKESAPIQG